MNITHFARTLTCASLLLAFTACSTAPRTQTVQLRTADEILADIEATPYPAFDPTRRSDQAYIAEYSLQREQAQAQRGDLILELYHTDANHERVATLMPERWQAPPTDDDHALAMKHEMAEVSRRFGADTTLGAQARYMAAAVALNQALWGDGDRDYAVNRIEQFAAELPDDPRAASLLFQLAAYGCESGSAEQIALLTRVRDTYADSEDARAAQTARSAAGQLRQVSAIGSQFDFAFTCAVTGSEVETASLAGKVVVIDFWATWCGPCVAKMPQMKELYAKYRERGVEFIGISLDQPEEQGGRERLLAFVKDNDLQWPQWYQGHGWQSEFSTHWGISGIPTLFILDAKGNLRSTSARSNLEDLIVELLDERDADRTRRSAL